MCRPARPMSPMRVLALMSLMGGYLRALGWAAGLPPAHPGQGMEASREVAPGSAPERLVAHFSRYASFQEELL